MQAVSRYAFIESEVRPMTLRPRFSPGVPLSVARNKFYCQEFKIAQNLNLSRKGLRLKERAAGADEEGLALEFGSFLLLLGEGILETDGDPAELVQ